MGAAGSVLEAEASKPINCSDIGVKEAKDEVRRLRLLLREHQGVIHKINSDPAGVSSGVKQVTKEEEGEIKPKAKEERPPIRQIPNFEKYDNDFAKCFDLNDSPTLKDYLLNSFYRFCGDDGVLEWDGNKYISVFFFSMFIYT
jgi:hypothetical protein